MKFPKPFFRTSAGCYYVQFGKRQYSLGTADEQEALKKYAELLQEKGLDPNNRGSKSTRRVWECFEIYLEHSELENASTTHENYVQILSYAAKSFGNSYVADLKPMHLTIWLRDHDLGDSTRRLYLAMIKAALNYCKKEGYISENPIQAIPLPKSSPRTRIFKEGEWETLLSYVKDKGFRDYLIALRESGARPGELNELKAEDLHLEDGYFTVLVHKNARKTKKPRRIFCSPILLELLKSRLAITKPGNYLFVNRSGRKWAKTAVCCRLRLIREKNPELAGIIAYTFRHDYITRGLQEGVPVAVMAELCGNSPKVIEANYNHLSQKFDLLREAASKARGATAVPEEASLSQTLPSSDTPLIVDR